MEKKKGGRPPAIKSTNELEKAIDEYQIYCEEKQEPFTLIGLAVFMGIDRDTLKEYAKKDEFSATYKKAKSLAERALVNGAMTNKYNPTVSIFLLKNNHGYKDVKAVELTGEEGKPIQQEIEVKFV